MAFVVGFNQGTIMIGIFEKRKKQLLKNIKQIYLKTTLRAKNYIKPLMFGQIDK